MITWRYAQVYELGTADWKIEDRKLIEVDARGEKRELKDRNLQQHLNEMGDYGWELVAVSPFYNLSEQGHGVPLGAIYHLKKPASS